MKTIANLVTYTLLLGLTVAAQSSKQSNSATGQSNTSSAQGNSSTAEGTSTSVWSTPWTPQVQMNANVPATVPSSKAVPGVASPIVPPTSSDEDLRNKNPLVTTTTAGPVKIGPGDLLDIGVFDSPELATRERVGSDGEISFPLLGKLQVGDMSPLQVQSLIRERLVSGDLVKSPQVSVFVEEYTNQGVFVLGEVSKPGVYPLIGSHQLFDFISAAGGLTPIAGKSIIITRHSNPQAPETVHFSRDPNFAAGNPQIEAGDTVYVSKAGVVYVVGEVNKPGGFLMVSDQNMSVMEALATAEGAKFTAALGSVRLIRKTDQGRTETAINIKHIFELDGQDPLLHDQDILYVPRSGLKVGVQSFLTFGVSAATSAMIYRF